MKKIILIGTLITAFSFGADAQNAGATQKRKQQGNEQKTRQRDTDLIGNDNESDNEEANENDRANYRNNQESGNPNNRTITEGSNRESESGVNTSEFSESTPAGNANSGAQSSGTSSGETGDDIPQFQGDVSGTNTDTNSSSNNNSSVIEHTSSGSGSPAVPAGKNARDGTNTVQKAQRNMAGGASKGMNTGNKNIDQDQEIRKGTGQQQKNNTANTDDAQVGTKGNTGVKPASKTQATGAKPQAGSDQKQVAGPASGGDKNTGVKQAIDSKAENTNGREVTDDNKPTQVKAMDTESKLTSDEPKNEKSKKHKKKHKH